MANSIPTFSIPTYGNHTHNSNAAATHPWLVGQSYPYNSAYTPYNSAYTPGSYDPDHSHPSPAEIQLYDRVVQLERCLAALISKFNEPNVYHGRPVLGSSGYELVRRERRAL